LLCLLFVKTLKVSHLKLKFVLLFNFKLMNNSNDNANIPIAIVNYIQLLTDLKGFVGSRKSNIFSFVELPMVT
jgi:hypothetical protein